MSTENMDVAPSEEEVVEPQVNEETPIVESDRSDAPDAVEKNDNDSHDEESLPEPDLEQEDGKKKKEMPEWVRKRLDKERREADSLRAELERYKASQAPLDQSLQNDIPLDSLPNRDDFDSEAEFVLAVTSKANEIQSAKIEAARQQQAFIQKENEFRSKLTETIDKGRSKYSNFDEVVEPVLFGKDMPSNRAMAEAILSSDYKDDILMYLGQRFENAKSIALMNPVLAIKEIAKIESRFEKSKKANITKAPKPLSPINAAKGNVGDGGDPNKMGMEDFKKWYARQYKRA